MNKNVKAFLALAAVVGIGYFGYKWWDDNRKKKAIEKAKQDELAASGNYPAVPPGTGGIKQPVDPADAVETPGVVGGEKTTISAIENL